LLTHHKKLKRMSLALCGAFLLSPYAYADSGYGHETHQAEMPLDTGLIESLTGFNYNETNFMQSLGVKFGGWTEIGFAGNPKDPDGTNGPVTFNDKPNDFRLHQVYGFIEREADRSTDTISFGFRADLLYGTDGRFSFANNFDTDVLNSNNDKKLIFPQVYGEIFLPVGNGVTAKVGHFYTLIGYEVVPSTGNFFFSHAYTMQYGEPFTHTGALLSYPINDNIEVTGGVVTGWDSHFDQPANFLGSVAYSTDDEGTSLTTSLITGDVRTNDIGVNDDHNRTMYSVVLEHDLTDRLHYVLQHDFGYEESTAFAGSSKWYGINQYMFYDVLHNLTAGIRGEWFRDEDGVRVLGDGRSQNFWSVTGGVNYTPIAGFTIRPEVRYDRNSSGNAFNDGKKDDQVLLSVSGIFRF
jgi:Putative beta-barrel porin-2, OmpL-like. bbp2